MKFSIPSEVRKTAAALEGAGFEAYLVGGCVRDLMLQRDPKDWDIATGATPEEMQKIFPESVYENQFGTVGVKTGSEDQRLAVVEVTTFRVEGKYTDKRHPDEVKFAETIEEDLSRRDFTVNAMALSLTFDVRGSKKKSVGALYIEHSTPNLELVDPFGGQADLKAGVIRAVGDPAARFDEDALRLLRAVRFAAELGFRIETKTREALAAKAPLLEMVAKERIRDEFSKLIMSPDAAKGILLFEDAGLLKFVLPELCDGIGVSQNKHHIYTVFEHNVKALDYSAKQGYSLEIRLASLLHDLGKPKTKRGEGPDSTFHGHEMIGARMAAKALERLRFSNEVIEKVIHLIRYHMFYYNVGEVSDAGVRRFVRRVGPESIDDLLKVREADRIGSGVPKAVPYKLRHLLFMIEKVKHDPVSPKMLRLKGDGVMKILGIAPGPRVGWILQALLEEVLDDPLRNSEEYLSGRAKRLGNLSDGELKKLASSAAEAKEEIESEAEAEMKRRHKV
ncbi:MAG: HD domain-containing protein [Patescibacteria group bacterium]|nr:HD domain-containing protein [Patescibacteria group bacterium]